MSGMTTRWFLGIAMGGAMVGAIALQPSPHDTRCAIALRKSPNTDYTVTFPNHKVTRQVLVNFCEYVV